MSEIPDDIIQAVGFEIFKAMKYSNMADADWYCGAILGVNNAFRDRIISAAKGAILAERVKSEDLRQDRNRWKEDSLEQARAINRMAKAAEDRNQVDAAREILHANDVKASHAAGVRAGLEMAAKVIATFPHTLPQSWQRENQMSEQLHQDVADSDGQVAELQATIDRLRKALEPFVEAARAYLADRTFDSPYEALRCYLMATEHFVARIMRSHLVRARDGYDNLILKELNHLVMKAIYEDILTLKEPKK